MTVVKVGGSLYDLPDLGPRLRAWLRQFATEKILIVPGGGRTADVVRDLDRIHLLGDERAHWLALHALRLNADFLKALLPSVSVVDAPCEASGTCILDALAFLRRDGALPHCWSATSDSIAAHAAVVFGAHRLILLKSITIPERVDWETAAERGFVDAWFARTIKPALPRLQVRAVNFRDWTP